MYKRVEPFFLYAISPLHMGSGSKVGVVDLPIQRETHTGFPKMESSGIKGVLKAHVKAAISLLPESLDAEWKAVFGSELDDRPAEGQAREESTSPGAVAFADARILLFPVRSMRGVFAYVTCPMVIKRFNQEIGFYPGNSQLIELPIPEERTVTNESKITFGEVSQVMLEEYTFSVNKKSKTDDLAGILQKLFENAVPANLIKERLIVLTDDEFADFVTMSTEVQARIKINSETGTVDSENGALWYEENVPPEAVFYSFLFAGSPRDKKGHRLENENAIVEFLQNKAHMPSICQFGGNYSLGRGMMRLIWAGGQEGAGRDGSTR